MAKITKVIDAEFVGANKYNVGGRVVEINHAPDSILQAGTAIGSELMNEIQKNCIYSVLSVRKIEGQKEIFDINIEGANVFDFETLQVLLNVNESNSSENCYIRLANTEYKINSIKANDIKQNSPSIFILNKTTQTADFVGFVRSELEQVKRELKDEIDGKLSKAGDTATGKINFNAGIGVGDTNIELANGRVHSYTSGTLGEQICIRANKDNGSVMLGNETDIYSLIKKEIATFYKNLTVKSKVLVHADSFAGNSGKSNISLAVGDDDTGFDWKRDGVVCYKSNGVELFELNALQCPYHVGQLMITTWGGHPATWYPGTTWDRISGRFILGAESDSAIWQTGGSWSVVLGQQHIPPHTHDVIGTTGDSGNHYHYMEMRANADENGDNPLRGYPANSQDNTPIYQSRPTSTNGLHSHSFSVVTSSVGNGWAFDVSNPYIKFAMWIRTS